jgi:tripeptide aminopeptidase
MVNRGRMLKEFLELVQIHCSSGKERQVGDFVGNKLTELGLEAWEDNAGEKTGGDCGNIMAYVEGTVTEAPVLLLTAHLDCVEPCRYVKPQRKEGKITSGGDTVLGADDKAGVVSILEALRVIQEDGIEHGGLQVIFTVQEENGLIGSKNIDRRKIKGDFGYALDSSGEPGKVIIRAPGENTIKVRVRGKTAHAGIEPEKGINAIVLAGKALAQVKQGRMDEETTANVGIIKGGQATNIVPDLVEITCEARSHNMDKLAKLTADIRSTYERVVTDNGGQAEVEIMEDFAAYRLSEDSAVAALAAKAAASIGLTAVWQATGGGSDANIFNYYGIPTAVLGMGMTNVHTTDEYIREEDLYEGAELAVALIKAAAAGGKSLK